MDRSNRPLGLQRSFRRSSGIVVVIALATVGLSACTDDSAAPGGAGQSTGSSTPVATVAYEPGTRSTATNRPANPILTRMAYRTDAGGTSVVANVTAAPGGPRDRVTATLEVFPSLDSRQRPPTPIAVETRPVTAGENQEVVLPIPPEALAVLDGVEQSVADQLVVVSVAHVVDGDADGNPEGSLHARSSYHDAQVRAAGETVALTIATDVAGVNVTTVPIVCMYQDSDSNFAPLTTTLVDAGDYVSSSIEADGSIFDSPTYGGPPWAQIESSLTADAAVDVARLILGALSPVNIASQAIVDVISLGIDDCDTQASVFSVLAAAQVADAQGQSQTTSQAYVASEQTSNGLLSAATALAWQENSQEEGGTVWQETVSNQYLAQAAQSSADQGLSIAATNQSVGTLTTSSAWTFTIQQGGTSSIPNGCDDRGC